MREVVAVWTLRNLGGVALLLFGSTYLWITPEFVTAGLARTGSLWAVVRVLALVTVLGFTVATWGLFQRAGWWESVAVGSAALGLVALVPYLVAASRAGEEPALFNAAIHAVGATGVLVLLLVPSLERWVDGHVMAG
jgi:dipeptide/tripeptide permease